MSMTTHQVGELNNQIHTVTISMCAVLHTMLYQGIHALHAVVDPTAHHSTPLLLVMYFGVE